MLATDQKQSVLAGVSETAQVASVYSAYGYREGESASHGAIGFNGQAREEGTSWYHLGNGYRVYNPKLMKFHSPDDYGPYGEAGFNLYAYCLGDPVNYVDPTGNFPGFLSIFRGIWRGLKFVFGPARNPAKTAKAGKTFQGFSARSQGARVGGASSSSNPNANVLGSSGVDGQIDYRNWTMHGHRGIAKKAGFEFNLENRITNKAAATLDSYNPPTARPASVSSGSIYDIPYETVEAPVKAPSGRPAAASKGAAPKQTRSSQAPAADRSQKASKPARRTAAKKDEAAVDANQAVRDRLKKQGKFQWEQ